MRLSPSAPLCLGWLLAVGACAQLPAKFSGKEQAASAAYSGADYARAAVLWEEAARNARDERTRQECVYREAVSFERAGSMKRAAALYEQLELANGERAPRAAFARAELAWKQGQAEQAQTLLRSAVLGFPSSGLAPQGLARFLERLAQSAGREAALHAAAGLATASQASELAESSAYQYAVRLERAGFSEQARDAYLDIAQRFPYPQGALWDDALFAAARLEEALGRVVRAQALLQRLLAEREFSRGGGSYERVRYAEARFHLAELYRDRFGQPQRARAEFRRVWAEHPTSRLADDALFEEALLGRSVGDGASVCDATQRLRTRYPQSRYTSCSAVLCPRQAAATATCRPYILRRIEAVLPRETSRGSPTHSSSR